jgi:alpha-beta hydrolase superfamily lysophospholipase
MMALGVGAVLLVIVTVSAIFWGVSVGRNSNPPGDYVELLFTTSDGVRLHGRLFGSGNPGVILAHMEGADQRSWQPFAETIAGAGLKALTFDFRGHGRSGGKKEAEKLDLDMAAAVQVMRDQGARGILLMGAGMGGAAALKMAAQEQFLGVLTLSAPTEFEGLDALAGMGEVEMPIMLIVAEDDEAAQKAAGDLFDAAPEERVYQAFRGGEHGTDMLSGPLGEEVQESLRDFLDAWAP